MSKRTMFIIIGVMVMIFVAIAAGILAFMPTVTSAFGGKTTPTPQASMTVATTATPVRKGAQLQQYLRQNAQTIRAQIAQGLKLTPLQLLADLRAGQTLSQIATAQGLSTAQLQALIGSTLQTTLQPKVASGDFTQKQVDTAMQRFQKNPDLLDPLLGGRANKNKLDGQGTPGSTPTVDEG